MKFVYDHSMCLEKNFIHEMCMKISNMTDHTHFIYEILYQTHTMIIQKFHTFFINASVCIIKYGLIKDFH